MEHNIERLKKLAKVFDNANVITSEDIQEILSGVLSIMNSFKKDNQTLNNETKVLVEALFNKVLEEHSKFKKSIEQETSQAKQEMFEKMKSTLKEIKTLSEEIKLIKPADGKDADEEKIVQDVLSQIKIPEQKEVVLDTPEQLADKLESLQGDKRLDASAIKNLPTFSGRPNGGGWRNLFQLHDVQLTDPTNGQVLSYDSDLGVWKNQNNSTSVAWGDITGTLSNQTDLQAALDGFVPYTGATQDVDLGSNALITTTLRADGSGGLLLESNSGTDVVLLGAGGGAGATFYGGVNIGTTTTAGTATTSFSPTMSGSSAVSNFLNITGTMPSSTSAIARAIHLSITSQGSSSNSQYLMNMSLGAGYTGSSTTAGINLANLAAGTGSAFWTNGSYNVGIYSSGSGSTAGHNVGFAGNASASSALNVGVYGRATSSTNTPNLNIGSVALATGATYNIGAFFGLFSAAPTIAQSAVVMADNGSTGSDIFVARVNGTKTTTIDGTGNLGVGTTPTVRLDVLGNTNLVNTNNFRSVTTSQDTSSVGPLLLTQSVTDQTVTGALKNVLIDVTVDYPSAPSVSTTNNALSVYASVPSTNTTSSTNVNITGFNVSSRAYKTTGNIGIVRGLNIAARSDSGGTTSSIIGNTTISTFAGASGTVSGNVTGVNGQAIVSSAATSASVAGLVGLLSFVGNSSATSTVTNAYGLQISNLSNSGTITNTYGIYTGDLTTGTQTNQAYNIYLSDTSARNYLGGNTEIIGNLTFTDNTYDIGASGATRPRTGYFGTSVVTPLLTLGTGSITMTGSIAATGARVTKGWFTDIESTNMPTVGGTSLSSVTATFSNKRIVPRVTSIASSATPTINTDNCDAVDITALATDITSMTTNLSGTPNNFDKLTFRIKDDGTARAITWGASFVANGVALPTTTVISKLLTVGFIWNGSTWGCVASVQEA